MPSSEKLLVFLTQDWHPNDHCSFNDFPEHCVRNTPGAELHPGLKKIYHYQQCFLIKKGRKKEEEAFSGFKGTYLYQILKHYKVKQVFVCGLATDYCVKATALDAQKLGFKTSVILDACRGVAPGGIETALKEMQDEGIKFIEL